MSLPARHEQTSKRVAKIAGKVLTMKAPRFVQFGVTWDDIRTLAASCLTQAASNEMLRERLEMTYVWVYDKKKKRMVRRKMEPGETIPDGIECRDETIRLQDRWIKVLSKRLPKSKLSNNETLRIRVRANGFDEVLTGPVSLSKFTPKRVTGPARIKSKKPSIDRQRVLRHGP